MTATTRTDEPVPTDVMDHLLRTLAYARERDYTGWDLYDGESSRLLRAIPIDSKWLNLAFQQVPRRAPINLRRPLLVEQRRNFMGAALFALANFGVAALTDHESFRREATRLVDWLVRDRCEGYAGFCGGHNHPVQGLSTRTTPDVPGIVGTAYAVKALLVAGERIDGRYREIAHTASRFVIDDLDYEETPDGARIDYTPVESDAYDTLNAIALGARLLIDCHATGGDDHLRQRAGRLLDHVVARQTDAGGWPYRDPPDSSHLSMDNFHNGFVIEALLRYRAVTGTDRYDEPIRRGLEFYRGLFDGDGAPHYDESNTYPRDVHASAQGGIVFSQVDPPFGATVLRWAIDELSDGNGRFYHERRRLYTKRITLMRWCQAWMAYALARHAVARSPDVEFPV